MVDAPIPILLTTDVVCRTKHTLINWFLHHDLPEPHGFHRNVQRRQNPGRAQARQPFLFARNQRGIQSLGDGGQRKLVAGYTAALQHHDIDRMLALLTEDATWSMPPIPTWFRGHEAIAAFCADAPFRYCWRSRPARANGQLAVGCYWRVETAGAYVAYALNVLDLREDRISSIVSFIGGERFAAFGLPPELPG